MRDFPPTQLAYEHAAAPRPDTRSPVAFLRWLAADQAGVLALSLLVASLWTVPMALVPWVFGRAIDQGIVPGDEAATTRWVLLLLALTLVGAGCGIAFHTLVVRSWVIALHGTTRLVTNKALQLGHVLPRRTPTGEVLSVSGSDGDEYGAFLEVAVRAAAQLLAFGIVAVIVLRMSLLLGVVLLLMTPLMLAAASPFLRPMQRWQTIERARNSDLTSQATDIVAGLRILRGIGGEATFGSAYAAQSQRVRTAGVRAGSWQAGVDAFGVFLFGVLLVVLMYLGVAQVADGALSIGDLVAFLGYTLFLVQPMRTFFEFAYKTTRALVSARRTIAVLEQEPPWRPPVDPVPLDPGAELIDEASGLRVAPGRLTMLVAGTTDEAAALADRLGRYLPGREQEAISLSLPEGLRGKAARSERDRRIEQRREQALLDERAATRAWGVHLGGVDLAAADLPQVRSTILVADTGATVFAGTLREALDPSGRLSREQAEAALHAAAAEDVYESLPGGWQAVLEERARGLSGGQRQRLVLARALAADPPSLVLVEPTSAVDAHTEARIAQRLPAARAGRTTLITTSSPLWLRHADEVVLVLDGHVVAKGTHESLVRDEPRYRDVVLRADAQVGT
ncbi:ABC-type multidrug transport system fused ATPase/permease subunit [Kineosphaera limosa]|uniref:Putative ABC transporter permease/ATP-binding protein n=1 Tax=Kineosphaera limosa NBRC 100340 TaxID=1184609 RepID=K6VJK1_9MICO|nr:ABC transporter ATP-binding protein [Kineosphaera limosa]NYE00781.1 ABC-type multidrug transport system fused ATPase/permease subunit [Kineosphaera limosa]GAB96393.1 putative ABC transporter permease/ATP-binding protein [Kineosphaera limosa NBRC 100340]